MRYSLILASITGAVTIVSAFPHQHDTFLSERDALAYPEYHSEVSFLETRDARDGFRGNGYRHHKHPGAGQGQTDQAPVQPQDQGPQGQTGAPQQRRDPNFWSTVKHDASVVAHDAGKVAKVAAPIALQYAPEIIGALAARDILERDPSFWSSLKHDVSAVAHGAGKVAKAVGHDVSAVAHGAGKVAKVIEHDASAVANVAGKVAKVAAPIALQYGPEIAALAARDILERDPNFWSTVKHDASAVAHDAGKVAKVAAPIALQYAPEIIGALAARDILERDPNFWDTVKHDASVVGHDIGQAAKAAAPYVLQYGPSIAEAIADRGKGKRSLWDTVKTDADKVGHAVQSALPDIETYGPGIATAAYGAYSASKGKPAKKPARRWAEPEADFEEIYARDPNFWQTLKKDAKKVGQGLEKAAEVVAPIALQAATHLKARDLLERDPNFWQTFKHDAGVVAQDVLPFALTAAPDIIKGMGKGKRDPNFWSTVKHDASTVAHDVGHAASAALPYIEQYGPGIAQAGYDAYSARKKPARRWAEPEAEADFEEIYRTLRRDPSFWNTVKTDAENAAHAVGQAAEAALPDIATYGPGIATAAYGAYSAHKGKPAAAAKPARRWAEPEADYDDLFERDFEELYERDFAGLYERDPNFWQTLKHDAGQVAQTVAPIALQAATHIKRDADADFDGLYERDAEPEAEFEELYERDAEPEAEFEELLEREAEPEAAFEELYEREAEPEAVFEELIERDAELDGFLGVLKARGLGYFESFAGGF